jgi:hypothetical protein
VFQSRKLYPSNYFQYPKARESNLRREAERDRMNIEKRCQMKGPVVLE